MRPVRIVSAVIAAGLCAVAVLACASASPGWTYTPAPAPTEAPSVEASAEPSASAEGDVQISAAGIAFEQAEVNAPAGKAFTIAFANNDAGVPHNIVIHKDSATGEAVFEGEIFNGVETRVYDVPALDAGTYAFVCAVHPNMVGTLTAE